MKGCIAEITPAFGTSQDQIEAHELKWPWETFSDGLMMDCIVIND